MVGVALFNRRWWKTTLLVFVAVLVMVRLGIWQLDRLDQRRAFNARVKAQMEQPPLELTATTLRLNLSQMEYREVIVKGEYDFNSEVALRNQVWNNLYGVHLLTPLRIDGSDRYVLVDRGWIPGEDFNSGDWSKYREEGQVTVHGVIRASQTKPDFGGRTDPTLVPGEKALKAWHLVNVERIGEQVPYPLLPIYIQQLPDSSWVGPPYRSQPEIELSEGPHLGYAIQWFTFAIILGLGYPLFVHRNERMINLREFVHKIA